MVIAKSEDITVRAFEPDDTAEFTSACLESVETVGKWMPWCNEAYTQDTALSWISLCSSEIEAGNAFDLGVFRNSDSLFVGSIAINRLDKQNRIGNIGYWVRQSLQQQGYALKAINLIKKYGFQKLHLVRLEIVVLEENMASRRAAECAGAEFECQAKNRLMHDGIANTAAVYSFTSSC